MVWIAWAIIALANIGFFFCEKTWWWPTTGSTQISGTPHLCQRQVIIRNQLVDDCMLGFGWEIWPSVHPILELGEIRVSWQFIISPHPKRSWTWLPQHRFWGGKETLIPFLEKTNFWTRFDKHIPSWRAKPFPQLMWSFVDMFRGFPTVPNESLSPIIVYRFCSFHDKRWEYL